MLFTNGLVKIDSIINFRFKFYFNLIKPPETAEEEKKDEKYYECVGICCDWMCTASHIKLRNIFTKDLLYFKLKYSHIIELILNYLVLNFKSFLIFRNNFLLI